MGGVSSNSNDGLNVELNLVPFIDLLSSLVLFLLITAVWVQISAIPTGIDSKGATPVVTSTSNLLTIHLDDKGATLLWPASMKDTSQLPSLIAKTAKGYDLDRLGAVMADVSKNPNKPTAAVSAEDVVDYGDVVQAIDTVKSNGFETVALSTN